MAAGWMGCDVTMCQFPGQFMKQLELTFLRSLGMFYVNSEI